MLVLQYMKVALVVYYYYHNIFIIYYFIVDIGCYIIDISEREFDYLFYSNCFMSNTSTMSSQKYTVFSFTMDENSLNILKDIQTSTGQNISSLDGHYVVSYYFDSMDTEKGKEIKALLKENFYYKELTSIMATAYNTIFLWEESVEIAHSFEYELVKKYSYKLLLY